MSDLGEEFAKICIQWLKKAETLKKILENSTLSRYVKKKKKKKKSRPTNPIFKFWSGEGNITFFFFWPYKVHIPSNNLLMALF